MNSLQDIKIVYKKPNEYDNATLSMYSNYTNDTDNLDNKEIVNQDNNVSELKKSESDNELQKNYSDEQIEQIVLNIKKNIVNYKSKEDVIRFIDKFFELNKFNDNSKNKILIKLDKIIIEQVKNIDNKQSNLNSNNITNKENDNKNDVENKNNIFGLGLNYWFGISLFIIILLFMLKKK